MYPYLVENHESLSAVSTEAAKREIAESPKSSRATRLPKHEDAHEYPLVAELCKVIQSNTETVVVDSAIADSLRKHRPVHQQELINNSVQIWGNKLDSLGLEIIHVGDSKEMYYASNASYDPELLGLGRGVLASTESKVDCLVL